MRKNYLDNLRWLCVLILFPYHTFMVFNSFGESFYVKGANVEVTSKLIVFTWPWIMPLLFLIAGISSAYALKARTPKEYLKERVFKLLVPFVFGLLLLVPIQTYFAELFHNSYTGNYFDQYILFFTKPTDLSGYGGGFTPAHLWFILYLFVISVICLPVMARYQKAKKKLPAHKIPLVALLSLFVIPVFSQMILDIGGKSVGEYLTYFLFGYFLISDDTVQEKLRKNSFWLLGLALAALIPYTIWGFSIEAFNKVLFEFLYSFAAWTTILAIIGLGARFLNFKNSFTAYMSKASFSIYIFHQQWIVVTAYFILMWVGNIPLQMILIMLSTVAFTFLNYEVFRRIPATRLLFGIRK